MIKRVLNIFLLLLGVFCTLSVTYSHETEERVPYTHLQVQDIGEMIESITSGMDLIVSACMNRVDPSREYVESETYCPLSGMERSAAEVDARNEEVRIKRLKEFEAFCARPSVEKSIEMVKKLDKQIDPLKHALEGDGEYLDEFAEKLIQSSPSLYEFLEKIHGEGIEINSGGGNFSQSSFSMCEVLKGRFMPSTFEWNRREMSYIAESCIEIGQREASISMCTKGLCNSSSVQRSISLVTMTCNQIPRNTPEYDSCISDARLAADEEHQRESEQLYQSCVESKDREFDECEARFARSEEEKDRVAREEIRACEAAARQEFIAEKERARTEFDQRQSLQEEEYNDRQDEFYKECILDNEKKIFCSEAESRENRQICEGVEESEYSGQLFEKQKEAMMRRVKELKTLYASNLMGDGETPLEGCINKTGDNNICGLLEADSQRTRATISSLYTDERNTRLEELGANASEQMKTAILEMNLPEAKESMLISRLSNINFTPPQDLTDVDISLSATAFHRCINTINYDIDESKKCEFSQIVVGPKLISMLDNPENEGYIMRVLMHEIGHAAAPRIDLGDDFLNPLRNSSGDFVDEDFGNLLGCLERKNNFDGYNDENQYVLAGEAIADYLGAAGMGEYLENSSDPIGNIEKQGALLCSSHEKSKKCTTRELPNGDILPIYGNDLDQILDPTTRSICKDMFWDQTDHPKAYDRFAVMMSNSKTREALGCEGENQEVFQCEL